MSIDRIFRDIIEEQSAQTANRPPVQRWNPPLSGVLDLCISRDGQWFHEGDPIRREALVRTFSSILKKEGESYFLVSPMEKWRITVEDVPFQVTGLEVITRKNQQALLFETGVGDRVVAGPDHPIRVVSDPRTGEPAPYLLIRGGMEGRLSRNVFYELAALAEVGENGEKAVHGVYSLGLFFPLE